MEINQTEERPLSKEDYEFLEDFIATSDLATSDEFEYDCVDGFCITKDGSIKVNPKNQDFYNYLQSRNKQKRINHLNQKRKMTLSLIK